MAFPDIAEFRDMTVLTGLSVSVDMVVFRKDGRIDRKVVSDNMGA